MDSAGWFLSVLLLIDDLMTVTDIVLFAERFAVIVACFLSY